VRGPHGTAAFGLVTRFRGCAEALDRELPVGVTPGTRAECMQVSTHASWRGALPPALTRKRERQAEDGIGTTYVSVYLPPSISTTYASDGSPSQQVFRPRGGDVWSMTLAGAPVRMLA
jgi:hypothetical protein